MFMDLAFISALETDSYKLVKTVHFSSVAIFNFASMQLVAVSHFLLVLCLVFSKQHVTVQLETHHTVTLREKKKKTNQNFRQDI